MAEYLSRWPIDGQLAFSCQKSSLYGRISLDGAGFIVMDLARDPNATWSRIVRPLGVIRLAQGVHTRGDADIADESAGDNYNRECVDDGENENDESADNDEDGDVEGADNLNDEKENVNEGADDDEDGDVEGADNDEKENVNEGEDMVLVRSYIFIL
jgi:hypothetical protein